MTTTSKLITADDLLALPRGNGKRYELIRGVLVAKMGTGRPHGITVTRTSSLLLIYSDENGYGEVLSGEPGMHLDFDPDTVAFARMWPGSPPGRIPPDTQGYPSLAPDHAVEVKSPSNSNPEMAAKAYMWLSYGSQEVWVADPERVTVTVYRLDAEPQTLGEDDELTGGELLPGFATPVWRLFRPQR